MRRFMVLIAWLLFIAEILAISSPFISNVAPWIAALGVITIIAAIALGAHFEGHFTSGTFKPKE